MTGRYGSRIVGVFICCTTACLVFIGSRFSISAQETRPALSAPALASEKYPVLGGHFSLKYSPSDWTLVPDDQEAGFKRTEWHDKSEEVWVSVIEERAQFTQSEIPDAALGLIKANDSAARILSRGTRMVNGKLMHFQEVAARIDDLDIIFYGHYLSEAGGTIQITGWTLASDASRHRRTIEGFVAGLQARD